MQQPKINVVKLTETERKVMELLCQGLGPKEVGSRLTPKLQRSHTHHFIQRCKWKFGARTTYQACAIFGMLHPEIVRRGTHISVEGTEYLSKAK